jgi:hypothetical protein
MSDPNNLAIPPKQCITPTTPLRLEVAARIGFPDGSMSLSALRRLAVAKKLTVEIIAGKYYTTLAAIEEMRELCRVKAKAPASYSTRAEAGGSSKTDKPDEALAAMNATAQKLRDGLRSTSLRGTIRPKRSKAQVIPIKRK